MCVEGVLVGPIRIDGVTYEHDVLIDRGQVHKRKKKASKKLRDAFGHTPLSIEEEIPGRCRKLVIGTGRGVLPIMKEVKQEAKRRHVKLLVLPRPRRCKSWRRTLTKPNAILHLTC